MKKKGIKSASILGIYFKVFKCNRWWIQTLAIACLESTLTPFLVVNKHAIDYNYPCAQKYAFDHPPLCRSYVGYLYRSWGSCDWVFFVVRGTISDIHYWCVPGVVVWTMGESRRRSPNCGAICLDTIFRRVCILNLKLPSYFLY